MNKPLLLSIFAFAAAAPHGCAPDIVGHTVVLRETPDAADAADDATLDADAPCRENLW